MEGDIFQNENETQEKAKLFEKINLHCGLLNVLQGSSREEERNEEVKTGRWRATGK
jgi:hypothetical protein